MKEKLSNSNTSSSAGSSSSSFSGSAAAAPTAGTGGQVDMNYKIADYTQINSYFLPQGAMILCSPTKYREVGDHPPITGNIKNFDSATKVKSLCAQAITIKEFL